MPSNPENKYEDSHQKKERLQGELLVVLKDLERGFATIKKDHEKVETADKIFEIMSDQLEELRIQEKSISDELKNMDAEYENMAEGSEAKTKLEEKIDAKREEIFRIWEKMNSLQEKLVKSLEDKPGLQGDFEGSQAVINMNVRKMEDLVKQLKELEISGEHGE